MRALRLSLVRQQEDQHSPITRPQVVTPESPVHLLSAGDSARPGKLSTATLLRMQHMHGNAITQRTLADHTGTHECACLACKPQTRQHAPPNIAHRQLAPSVQAVPLVQRCEACGTQDEDQAAQSVQRWLWDDDADSDGSGGDSSDAEPATPTNEPVDSTDTESETESGGTNEEGGSSWWPFGGDSETGEGESEESKEGGGSWTDWLPDFGESDESESDDESGDLDEDAGEVGYGLSGDSRSLPAVTHYGKSSVYDAEGYCKWDNIESDANNDKIVTTTLPNNKIKATGTTVMTFTSNADYTLPSVPAAITNECEREKYQKAIDTTLRAHEEQHKAGFLTYNGTASAQVNVTADNEAALLAAVSAATLDPTTDARYNAAKKKSSDVDPPGGFKFTPDLSGCDKK